MTIVKMSYGYMASYKGISIWAYTREIAIGNLLRIIWKESTNLEKKPSIL